MTKDADHVITELDQLLHNLEPQLKSEDYVFCSTKEPLPVDFKPLATFQETEGLSVVCTLQQAQRLGYSYQSVMSLITLNVYSNLEAVGMTAAIAKVLTQAGISANVIAAFHHDHVFVPKASSHKAFELLKNLNNHS